MPTFNLAKAVCRKLLQKTLPGVSVPNAYLRFFFVYLTSQHSEA